MDWRKLFLEAHTIRRDGAILLRRKLRRADVICIVADLPACLVGIDACVWCIYWLVGWMTLGHKVRLELLAYVKRRKTDAADAEAICEAVTLPSMRVAAGKNVKQQAALTLHTSCGLAFRQQTIFINALRKHLAEYGDLKGAARTA